jgi:hypothetical protein
MSASSPSDYLAGLTPQPTETSMPIATSSAHHRPRRLRLGAAALALFLLGGCPPSSGGSGDLSGTYEAKNDGGSMTLVFQSGHKVEMTMQEAGGQPDKTAGDYLIDGNHVTIQIPGGMPMVLVRDGKTLSANMMGQILHFEKK